MSAVVSELTSAVGEIRRRGLRREVVAVVDEFRRHDLLLVASAMAFQVLTALAPVALLVLGLLGFFDLTEVWQRDLRPPIAESVRPAALVIIDDTVERVLDGGEVFWVTGGAALAVWQVSGAVRASMNALNRVYGSEEDRPLAVRLRTSILVAAAELVLLLGAVAVVTLGPLVLGDPGPVLGALLGAARWLVAAGLVLVAVGLIVRHGPDQAHDGLGRLSVGSVLVVVLWLGMSSLFSLYVTGIASYGSVFGNLATIVVLSTWLYLSAIAFLAGVVIDGLLRDRAS